MANIVKKLANRIFLEWKVLSRNETEIKGIRLKIDKKNFSHAMKLRLHRGKYELPEYELFNNKLTGEERILEMGAGIGFISTVMAKKLKPKSLVSYEVNPSLVSVIKRNMQLNKVDFDVRSDFLTTDNEIIDQEIPFYVAKNFFSSSFEKFEGYKDVIHLKGRSLNQAIINDNISMLVLDVEGYEYSLFRNWILPKQITKVCIEVHPYKVSNPFDIKNYLIEQNFIVDDSYLKHHVLYAFR